MSDRRIEDAMKIDNLIAWLKKQKPDGEYHYRDGTACLLHEYFADVTKLDVFVGTDSVGIDRKSYRLPDYYDAIAKGRSHYASDTWTFGDALKRAKAARELIR